MVGAGPGGLMWANVPSRRTRVYRCGRMREELRIGRILFILARNGDCMRRLPTAIAYTMGPRMRLFGRLTLERKVLLIQVSIVLLVVGLISATVVSVLARLVDEQAGERALGIAQAVALMPAV